MGENVEDYAKRFKRIMRKVNYTNGLVDGVQVNYFIRGLNPLYIAQVLMAAPANLNAAITQAKLLETGTQIAGLSVTEITNKGTGNDKQTGRNTFMREKDTEKEKIDGLIESFEKMRLNMANIEQRKTNRNEYDRNGGIQCYNCNGYGHMSRNCNRQNNYRQRWLKKQNK